MSRRRFTEQVGATVARWHTGALIGACIVLAELGARLGIPGVERGRISAFLQRVQWGPLRWFDLVVGRGVSRAAILALGIVPYAQARLYIWLVRTIVARVRGCALGAPSRRIVLSVTTGLALIQSVGLVRFLSSVAGAVTEPGVGFAVRTTLLLTCSSVALGWLTEALLNPSDFADGARRSDLGHAGSSRGHGAEPSEVGKKAGARLIPDERQGDFGATRLSEPAVVRPAR